MISQEEKLRILKIVEEGITTARVYSELYRHTEGDPAMMRIWKTLWLATDLVRAELRSCTSELPELLVEVERREPEAFSGMLDAEIERRTNETSAATAPQPDSDARDEVAK